MTRTDKSYQSTHPSLAGIYAIADDVVLTDEILLTSVEQALRAGVALLQYRSKTGSDQQRRRQAEALLALCRSYQRPLLINDDVSLCAEIAADGVHLGQQDAPLADARASLGRDAIIGITCHNSIELARRAQDGGADYVAFGRFFASSTKAQAPPANIDTLHRARQELKLPLVAIGGINADNGAALIAAGADMLAVAGALFTGDDVGTSTRKLVTLFGDL